MSLAIAPPHSAAFAPSRSTAGTAAASVYLALAACLAPLCVPTGPGQTAILDIVNLAALALAALLLLSPGRTVRVPMLPPALLVATGSLLAVVQAPSLGLAALALAQDAYLFAWFVLVVNLVQDWRALRALQVAWMWTAVAVALGAVGQVLAHDGGSFGGVLASRGLRPSSTLYNPNMLADYLVISLFISACAAADLPRIVRLAVAGVLLAGLVTTKSNGGIIALASGLVVWALVRALTRGVSMRVLAAVVALLLSVAGLAAWLNAEWGVGDGTLQALRQHTFVGRMAHSSQSRMRIWEQLERSYARSPLGIGPGNSGAISLGIAQRERPGSYLSKEAHSDYLAYAIERGPLGLLGLLCMTGASLVAVARFWRHASTGGRREPRDGAWTAAMAAALAASTVHSTVIEKLHFRHFWLLLAMVFGSLYLAAARTKAETEFDSEAPEVMKVPVPVRIRGFRPRSAGGEGSTCGGLS